MKKSDIDAIKSKMIETGDATAPAMNTEGLTEEERALQEEEGTGDEQLESGEEAGQEQGFEGEASDDEGAEGDEEDEAAAQGEQGEGEDVVLTATELAEAIGWEPQDVYEGVLVPLDDGQEPLPLGELKNRYQDQRRQITELEQQVENAGQAGEQQGVMGQISAEMMQLGGYMQQIDRLEKNTDWAELERVDPNEAVLRRQKIMMARQETQGKMREVYQRDIQIRGQHIEKAKTKLIELVPSWSDADAKKKDQTEIRSYLKATYQFTDKEINAIDDPRTMALLKEVVDLRTQVAAAKAAVKRVRKAPRVLRNTAGRFQSPDKGKQADAVVKRAKQTGKKGDQLNAAKAVLKQAFSK
jgi:hypothetical protein